MKKRILSLLCLLALCLGLLPVTALAVGEDAPDTLYVGGTPIRTSGYWTSSYGGTTWSLQSSKPSEGSYIQYDGNGTLTLNGATIKGDNNITAVPYGAGIYALCSDGQSVSLL